MSYVDPDLIEKFRQKSDKTFDYTKLVKLLISLNDNYDRKEPYACADLIRTIIDYTPPLLGWTLFSEVVANHSWDESERKMINDLQKFRPDGDSSLHTQISDKKDHFEIEDLPPARRINTLLEECYRHGERTDLEKATQIKRERSDKLKQKKGIEITVNDPLTNWQNYSAGRYMFYSFRVSLHIDNFNSSRSDYISVRIEGKTENESWQSNYFVFDDPKNTNLRPNEPLKIEGEDVRDISVCLSDMEPRTSPQEMRFRPVAGTNVYKVIVETKSGQTFTFEVKMVP